MDPRRILPAALALGVANALVFVAFEWLVNHGTDWLWDDVVGSNTSRWRVIPLAMVLSIGYALVLRLLDEPRVTKVEPHTHVELDESKPATFRAVWSILVIGLAGLLAGASLGPEMPLFAGSAALGLWAASVAKTPAGKLLALCSVAALLVAFFDSLVPILIPALLLFQQQRDQFLKGIVPVVIAGLAAYGTVELIGEGAFGTIPAGEHPDAQDYLTAFVLGVVAVLVAALLRFLVVQLNRLTLYLDKRWSWLVLALVFGGVLGVLYLAGGETIQFSGNSGSGLLVQRTDAGDYTALALLGILVAKLLATSWSLSTGSRGGLVFPSIFMGVAVSLFVTDVWGGLAGPGVTVGAVGGIVTAMTSPVLGPVMLLSLVPFSLLGVALAGSVGAILGDLAFAKLGLLDEPKNAPAKPAPGSA